MIHATPNHRFRLLVLLRWFLIAGVCDLPPAANAAPHVAPLQNQVINEEVPWNMVVSASDDEVPTTTLTFSLETAPAGAAIDPVAGVISWTPTEAQGPGTYTFMVRVGNDATPQQTDAGSFEVTVLEVNRPPQLQTVANRIAHAGQTVSVTIQAQDPDLPTNGLSYSLLGPTPPGASIDRSRGLFSWLPALSDVGQSLQFIVGVADTGAPSRSEVTQFTVSVTEPPSIRAVTYADETVTLLWNGIADHTYRVQFKDDLGEPEWHDLPGDAVATGEGGILRISQPAGFHRQFYRLYDVYPPQMTELSRSPWELAAIVTQQSSQGGTAGALATQFVIPLLYVNERNGELFGSGRDLNFHPVTLGGQIDIRPGTDGLRHARFSMLGSLGLSAVLDPTARTEFAVALLPTGMQGTFTGTGTGLVNGQPDVFTWSGVCSVRLVTDLRFVLSPAYYFSVFPKESLPYDYAEKLDKWIEEGDGKVKLNKQKKEEILGKVVIVIDPGKCDKAKAMALTEDVSWWAGRDKVTITLSARPCQLKCETLLDEYIHAAGFLAETDTSEEDDHDFRDYIQSLRLWGFGRKADNEHLRTLGESEAYEALSEIATFMEKMEMATGFSLGD